MDILSYTWEGKRPLEAELHAGFLRVSMQIQPKWGVFAATLWRADKSGLRIRCRMKEINPRVEVGVLAFDVVHKLSDDEISLDVPSQFKTLAKVDKLTLNEDSVTTECGVSFWGAEGSELMILASAAPYGLSVALMGILAPFQPEMPLNAYNRSNLFSTEST
jgi:hypothetical protein